MKRYSWLLLCGLAVFSTGTAAQPPDLSGTYDVATLTPLQRPTAYGDNLYLTPEQAETLAQRAAQRNQQDASSSDPNRKAPPSGGRVGGYNLFWIDRGDQAVSVDGKFRTSLITKPANGRIPPMTDYGQSRLDRLMGQYHIVWRSPDPTAGKDDGTAWWLREEGPDPYDQLEQRPLAERCIIGSRSTAGPPMLPNIYNNLKRIVQTEQHVMILVEMNHDARVIRLNAEHRPSHIRTWLGDSIGHWEGDTLVVDTTNFTQTPALSGADEQLHVVERFRRLEDGSLFYEFEVNNPSIWQSSWGGEYRWPETDGKVYEYACHEGNYALGNIMRGARALETEALAGE